MVSGKYDAKNAFTGAGTMLVAAQNNGLNPDFHFSGKRVYQALGFNFIRGYVSVT